jgi:hypothetical protein
LTEVSHVDGLSTRLAFEEVVSFIRRLAADSHARKLAKFWFHTCRSR